MHSSSDKKLCLFLLYQKAIKLSTDHKPTQRDELRRIQRAGGKLYQDKYVAVEVERVAGYRAFRGLCATSRSIGIVLPEFLLSFVCNILHWNWSLCLKFRWFCIQAEQGIASWRTNGGMQSRYSLCKYKQSCLYKSTNLFYWEWSDAK